MAMIHDTVFIEDELHFEIDDSALPNNIKAAIKATPIAEPLVEIGNSYNFLIGEIDAVYDLIKVLLLGQMSSNEFPNRLKEVLESDKHEFISEIIEKINKEIFLKIREKLYGTAPATSASSSSPTAPLPGRKAPYSTLGTIPNSPAKVSMARPREMPQTKPLAPEEATLSRETLLKEIEDADSTSSPPADVGSSAPPPNNLPTGTYNSQSIANNPPTMPNQGTPERPKTAWKIQPKPRPQATASPAAPTQPPPQTPSVAQQPEQSTQYAADPYREPLS